MQGIYAILDEKNFDFNKLDVIVKKMINRNIKYFQIRIKGKFSDNHYKIIKSINNICKDSNCHLILNDNIEIVKKLDLDGVHLGSEDIGIVKARKILGDNKIVGISCYNELSRAKHAEESKASYVSFGSLYTTKTKKNFTMLDESIFFEAKKMVKIPTCLIGGINISNFHHVKKLKSDLIAISEGLSSETDLIEITKLYAEN